MKTFQKSSLKIKVLLIAVLALIALGCGARKVQKDSEKEVIKTSSAVKSSSSGSSSTAKSDSLKQELTKTDKSKVVQTDETQISADSADYDPKTGKTKFTGNVKYSKKATKNTDKDKQSIDSKNTGFKESGNSNFVKDTAVHDESSSLNTSDTKNIESEGSVFYKPWFWILAFMLVFALFYFSKLWR